MNRTCENFLKLVQFFAERMQIFCKLMAYFLQSESATLVSNDLEEKFCFFLSLIFLSLLKSGCNHHLPKLKSAITDLGYKKIGDLFFAHPRKSGNVREGTRFFGQNCKGQNT